MALYQKAIGHYDPAMGRGSLITIGGIARNKAQTTLHFRRMLAKYLVGQVVNRTDRADLTELLARHPSASEKVGCGVAEFRISCTGAYGTRQFEVVRADGTTATFSYLLCIRAKGDPARAALWAMRCEVMEQTRAFFNAAFARSAVFCEITGERLTRKNAHVDHMRPLTFQRLAVDFLKSKGLQVSDVATTNTGPHRPPALSMADRDLASAWAAYHRDNARLRIASKRANLKERKSKVALQPPPTLFDDADQSTLPA